MSLRRRLLVLLLLTVTATGAISLWSSYEGAEHETLELFDAQLASSTRLLRSIIISDLKQKKKIDYLSEIKLEDRFTVEGEEHGHNHDFNFTLVFQVFDRQGQLILHSINSPDTPMQKLDHDYSSTFGFSDLMFFGERWRIYGTWDEAEEYLIISAQPYNLRDRLTHDILREITFPFILLLPILSVLLWIAVTQGLRPLKQVTVELSQRDENNLNPLLLSKTPKEILPLGKALNRLFLRLQHSLQKERRFTSDAAHELRTPLAGLRTHAQLALAAKETAPRKHALKQLLQGVDRASHLIDQLLTMARLEPENQTQQHGPLNLHTLAVDAIVQSTPMALEKEIDLGLADDSDRHYLFGSSPALRILLRNLIDNALRYTPDHGQVQVNIVKTEHQLRLSVCDSGPGIPKEEREQVFSRFYRGEDPQAAGCGIGLSIVKRICDLHNAKIELHRAELGGLQIDVNFPSVSPITS
ncbi:MAG: ATP-binding protein [Gammaproteobacteria bacterium]|nr:ATP-binding protein [Gammaproteobacteria bacterium]